MTMKRLGIWLAISCCVSSAASGETFVPALGARSAGRGGANLAYSDNGYVFGENPAGLLGATYSEQRGG
jgi:hypothetical protein